MTKKPFWKSKTIAGAVIAIIATIYGIDLSDVGGGEIIGILGGLLAIYGRAKAVSALSLDEV